VSAHSLGCDSGMQEGWSWEGRWRTLKLSGFAKKQKTSILPGPCSLAVPNVPFALPCMRSVSPEPEVHRLRKVHAYVLPRVATVHAAGVRGRCVVTCGWHGECGERHAITSAAMAWHDMVWPLLRAVLQLREDSRDGRIHVHLDFLYWRECRPLSRYARTEPPTGCFIFENLHSWPGVVVAVGSVTAAIHWCYRCCLFAEPVLPFQSEGFVPRTAVAARGE
jgi:hypothetical protein